MLTEAILFQTTVYSQLAMQYVARSMIDYHSNNWAIFWWTGVDL